MSGLGVRVFVWFRGWGFGVGVRGSRVGAVGGLVRRVGACQAVSGRVGVCLWGAGVAGVEELWCCWPPVEQAQGPFA